MKAMRKSKTMIETSKATPMMSDFSDITQKEADSREKYNNESIYNIMDIYRSFIPKQRYALVRVFARRFGEVFGGLYDYNPKMYIRTQSGAGNMPPITNPYPLSKKALIVSINNFDDFYKEGDVVSLSDAATSIVSPGNGIKTDLRPSYAFVHPDTPNLINYERPPRNLDEEEFGYLYIPVDLIEGIIKKSDVKE
tara:strand:+ start:2143 stop:2727 length:585 start_codon:yes stop_codon:yes gene_type:complete